MKKLFQRLMAKIQVIDSFNSQLYSITGGSSGIPALQQMAQAFFSLNMTNIADLLDETYGKLLDYYRGEGPYAKLHRTTARLRGANELIEANAQIKSAYPPRFPKEQQLGQREILNGLISRMQNVGYIDEKGQRILDLGPRQEAIDLCMSEEYWATASTVSIFGSSHMDRTYFPNGFDGRFMAKLAAVGKFINNRVPLTLTIEYNNMAKITLQYEMYYRMATTNDEFSRQIDLTHSSIGAGWTFPEPRYFDNATGLREAFGHEGYGQFTPQFVGECYNAFEDETYPIMAADVSHDLVVDLFKKLFEQMGVDYEKMENSPFSDPKFVYLATKRLIEAIPLPPKLYGGVALPADNLLDTHVTAGLMFGKLIEHCYYQEICNEYELVDASTIADDHEQASRIQPVGTDFVTYGKVIQYYARHVNGPSNGYNVALVLNDRTEEATFHLVYEKTLLDVKMTPQTVELFLASLEKTRTNLHNRHGDLS